VSAILLYFIEISLTSVECVEGVWNLANEVVGDDRNLRGQLGKAQSQSKNEKRKNTSSPPIPTTTSLQKHSDNATFCHSRGRYVFLPAGGHPRLRPSRTVGAHPHQRSSQAPRTTSFPSCCLFFAFIISNFTYVLQNVVEIGAATRF
jgi:hypothetical protein